MKEILQTKYSQGVDEGNTTDKIYPLIIRMKEILQNKVDKSNRKRECPQEHCSMVT